MVELMGDQTRKKFPDLIFRGLSLPNSSNSLFCWNKSYIVEYPKASRAYRIGSGWVQEVITGRSRDTASGGREGLRSLISLFGKVFGMLQKCVLKG
jgi:hypothetical protein